MRIRKSVAIMGTAIALAVASISVPDATAANLQQQSAQTSTQTLFAMYDNPILAPIAMVTSLSAMTGHYLIYCPIAIQLGLVDRYSGVCSF